MAKPEYPVTRRFRCTTKEARRLARIARHYDRTPSDILRKLVNEAFERLALPTPIETTKEE